MELSPENQVEFWLDAMIVARGLAEVLQPVKMNYEIHGNTIAHLHMHLYPRTPGDIYVGYPNHNRAHFSRRPEELQRIRDAIRVRLVERDRLVR